MSLGLLKHQSESDTHRNCQLSVVSCRSQLFHFEIRDPTSVFLFPEAQRSSVKRASSTARLKRSAPSYCRSTHPTGDLSFVIRHWSLVTSDLRLLTSFFLLSLCSLLPASSPPSLQASCFFIRCWTFIFFDRSTHPTAPFYVSDDVVG